MDKVMRQRGKFGFDKCLLSPDTSAWHTVYLEIGLVDDVQNNYHQKNKKQMILMWRSTTI